MCKGIQTIARDPINPHIALLVRLIIVQNSRDFLFDPPPSIGSERRGWCKGFPGGKTMLIVFTICFHRKDFWQMHRCLCIDEMTEF